MSAAPQLTVEQRVAELWRRGRLRYKLYPDQRELYDAIWAFLDDPATRFEDFWVDISRQFGKTFTGLLIATECAIRFPGWLIGYTAATRSALWQFVQPNMETLLGDCPADLRPEWSGLTNDYVFPGGSRIHLAGVNNGHENDARGPKRNLLVNEEAAFVDRFSYLHDSVELPMLTTTGGRILNITTPPETPGHESEVYMLKCKARGRYIQRTIEDNRHLSEPAKEKLIEEAGGRESTNCRRELFCEWVVDESRAAVPEWNAHEKAIVRTVEPPDYFYPLVALDVGFEDPTFGLFGFWDFKRAKLCIQREVFLRRATTDLIAETVKATELALWPWAKREEERHPDGSWLFEPWREQRRRTLRYSDTDLRLIADLSALHQMPFAPTAKDMKEAQVNELRMFTKDERIEVDPSCANLIRHFKTTIWNKQRTQWERTTDGHGDGVDAALYMLRNAPRNLNPYPLLPANVTPITHQLSPYALERARTPLASTVATIFGRN